MEVITISSSSSDLSQESKSNHEENFSKKDEVEEDLNQIPSLEKICTSSSTSASHIKTKSTNSNEMKISNGTIKPIDNFSIHRICSGQVIMDLCSAIKELLENSLDAGGTCIDIRVQDYGKELIEVIDNGNGISPSDFSNIGKKYHTSKISSFSDLPYVKSFGFRGEAISSLCAVGELSICTRAKGQPIGTRLDFDFAGEITQQTPAVRNIGTTVTLKNIFKNFPVRIQELQKNIKKEFLKVQVMLQAYAIICTGIKIRFFNETKKGQRNYYISTTGSKHIKENLSSIFSEKLLTKIGEISVHSSPYSFFGFISKIQPGNGRSTTDRQLFFINKRPVDLPKIAKCINEIYRAFNRTEYPIVIVNITLLTDLYDVNVTPNKRKIFFHQESKLISFIKKTVKDYYEKALLACGGILSTPLSQSSQTSLDSSGEISETSFSPPETTNTIPINKTRRDFLSSPSSPPSKKRKIEDLEDAQQPLSQEFKLQEEEKIEPHDDEPEGVLTTSLEEKNLTSLNYFNFVPNTKKPSILASFGFHAKKTKTFVPLPNIENLPWQSILKPVIDSTRQKTEGSCTKIEEEQEEFNFDGEGSQNNNNYSYVPPISHKSSSTTINIGPRVITDEHLIFGKSKGISTSILLMDLSQIRASIEKKNLDKKIEPKNAIVWNFENATLGRASDIEAIQELTQNFQKNDFLKMEIIGQYNLGFIIVKLYNNLFIIDQHAADEKHTFEILQQSTPINTQKLIQPIPLELCVDEEMIVINNLEIFGKNGFQIDYDCFAPITKRLKIISKPFSKDTEFGINDVHELIALIREKPEKSARLPRIRSMFASRACRQSIMFGKALNYQEMKRVIKHMEETESPWQCPHGRPTIRHLFDLFYFTNKLNQQM